MFLPQCVPPAPSKGANTFTDTLLRQVVVSLIINNKYLLFLNTYLRLGEKEESSLGVSSHHSSLPQPRGSPSDPGGVSEEAVKMTPAWSGRSTNISWRRLSSQLKYQNLVFPNAWRGSETSLWLMHRDSRHSLGKFLLKLLNSTQIGQHVLLSTTNQGRID